MSQKTNTNTCEKRKDTPSLPIVHSVDVKIDPNEDSSQNMGREVVGLIYIVIFIVFMACVYYVDDDQH